MHILDHFPKRRWNQDELKGHCFVFDIGATIGDSENGRVTAPDVKRFEHLMSASWTVFDCCVRDHNAEIAEKLYTCEHENTVFFGGDGLDLEWFTVDMYLIYLNLQFVIL